MNAFDTARGPRRATPPGSLDEVFRVGRRKRRVRQALTSLGAAAGVASVGLVAFVPSVEHGVRELASPIFGDPEYEGEEYVRTHLPYDSAIDTDDPGFCRRPGVTRSPGWCAELDMPRTVAPSGDAKMVYTLCREGGAETATVFWEDFAEVNFLVFGEDGVVWDWRSSKFLGTAQHDVDFWGGRCRTFTVTWTAIDTYRPAPPGTYTVKVAPEPNRVSVPEELPPPIERSIVVR